VTKTKKKTILTGDKRHRNNTTNGQRVSRHSLPTLLCFNFSQRTFLKTILASPQVAHLALPHPQSDPSQSQKSHFFAYAPTEIRILVNYILTIKE